MKNFLFTVAAGVTVGLIVNGLRKPAPAPAGNKAEDYRGTDFQRWIAQQGG